MTGARDMAGIGIPFAAGVAAGAFFFSAIRPSPVLLPAIMAAGISFIAIHLLFHLDSSRRGFGMRLRIALLFCFAGLFCSLNSVLTSGITIPPGPLGKLSHNCHGILQACIGSIPFPSQGTGELVRALVTGNRDGLDKATVSMFRASGASHILALSGLHLGIIYIILSKALSPLGNSPFARKARYSLIVSASGFYSLMTGASPSIIRAFLFISIGETGKLLGRERDPLRVFLAALTIQLGLKPEVVTTTGFQLSYLAVLGICTVFPFLDRMYPEGGLGHLDPLRKIWRAAALSVSCQVFTAPLVWVTFHTFPRYFLITNLIALPLTSAVMVLSVATIALSFLGICPDVLIVLDDRAVHLLTDCLEVISTM